ncbi:MAG TPA: hypothetical protein VFZ10_08445 [Geminicoccaceae bacterium]
MDDSIAVVAANIGKRCTGSQFGEANQIAQENDSTRCTGCEAHLRGPKQPTD